MTKRQKDYRKYLQTEHWKELRLQALNRDGFRCSLCGSGARLQVHHVKYRGKPSESLLEDLETLCRDCHRMEHGIGPNHFEMQIVRMKNMINRAESRSFRFDPSEWKKLKEETILPCEIEDFGHLINSYLNMKGVPIHIRCSVRDFHIQKAERKRQAEGLPDWY